MIKFTIITCTFNAASVLQRTLSSVLSQKYAYIEHLILDGLSKDDTVRMASDYKSRSDKLDNGHEVTVISEKDSGLYDAMNKGIRLATGEYLIFLNAGDVFPGPETLETIAASFLMVSSCLECFTEIPTSLPWMVTSCAIADCVLQRSSRGGRSNGECSFAIKHSTRERTLPRRHYIIMWIIVSQPTLTGVFA